MPANLSLVVLLVEILFFYGIARKAFGGTLCGRLWCGKIYLGGNRRPSPDLQCLIYIHPLWKKSSLLLIRPRNKAQVQRFCACQSLACIKSLVQFRLCSDWLAGWQLIYSVPRLGLEPAWRLCG